MFMAGTQGRVGKSSQRLQHPIAAQESEPIPEDGDKAVQHNRGETFLEGLNRDFRNLREDSAAWEDEEKERALWDDSVGDELEKQ